MVGELTENNVVTISGKVATQMKYSHEIYGEGFYYFLLDVPRLSDSSDSISVTISERLVGKRGLNIGENIEIEGQFRSYNSFGESGSKLILTVFAREVIYIDDVGSLRNVNKIFLNGFICKKPVYRSTPFGREITDLLIAVNRAYNKSDYIPCISWGRNARYCSSLNVGDNIKVWGRIQSRRYQKKMPDGAAIEKVAYEVSLSKLETADAQRQTEKQALDPADFRNYRNDGPVYDLGGAPRAGYGPGMQTVAGRGSGPSEDVHKNAAPIAMGAPITRAAPPAQSAPLTRGAPSALSAASIAIVGGEGIASRTAIKDVL